MANVSKPLLIASALVAAILLAFYFPFLTGSYNFFLKDLTQFGEPICRFIGEAIANGHWPLWNPYGYCGMSQAALPSPAVFFPLTCLFGLMQFSQALALIMVISQTAAFIGMFLLIELFEYGAVPAFIGAAAYALSGYMFSLVSNYTLVTTAAWIPLCVYLSIRCLRKSSHGLIVANAVAVYLLISSGRPELSVPSLLMVTILAFCLSGKQSGESTQLSNNIDLFKSLIIGALLSLPTVLPAMEWVPISRRAVGMFASETMLYSANWYDLLSMFIMRPLDDFQLRGSAYTNLIWNANVVPYFESAYVGTIPLALALIGLCKPGRLLYFCCLALLGLSVLFSLGVNVPFLGEMWNHIPGMSMFRFPSKQLIFSVLCLALFAARGARLYLDGEAHLIPHALGWFLLMAGCMYFFLNGQTVLPFADLKHPGVNDGQAIIMLRIMSQSGLAMLSLGFMWFMYRKGYERIALNVVAIGATGMLVLHAFVCDRIHAPFDYFKTASALMNKVKLPSGQDNPYRATSLALESFSAPESVDAADRLTGTIDNFQYERQVLKDFTNIDFHVPSQFVTEGSTTGKYYFYFLSRYLDSSQSARLVGRTTPDDLPLYRLLQAGSTSHVITQVERQLKDGRQMKVSDLDPTLFKSILEDRKLNCRVYELKEPLPRAYLSDGWQSIADDHKVIKEMADCRTSGFDPTKETLVECDLPSQKAQSAIVAVSFQSSQPENVSMDVNPSRQSLLVLQDQNYPGWRAQMDGSRVNILRCNGFFRAVMVPSGRHHITFQYQPKSVIGGWGGALIGLAWCLALLYLRRQPVNQRIVNES